MATSLTFQRERVRDAWPELYPLLVQNNNETGSFDERHFAPCKEHYSLWNDKGRLELLTARKDGELIGYGSYFITAHIHYPGVVVGLQDALFVKPEHRGMTGFKFLKWSEDALKEAGAQCIIRQVLPKPDYSKTLERLGYEPVHLTYMRRF